jgi:signal peptidase II
MQRTGLNRRIIFITISAVLLMVFFVLVDQISKIYIRVVDKNFTIIEGLLYFTHIENTGAAWGFLAGKSWAQLFFKILTGFSLIVFFGMFIYSCVKEYTFMRFGSVLVVAGTVGNFIDRLLFNSVTDFFELVIGNSTPFGIFNCADVFLSVGIVIVIIHFLFLDSNESN